jgi:uncharacterized membrane protein (UPF0127 family)
LPSPPIARRGLIAFLGAAVVSPLLPACATAKPPVCQPKQPTLKVEPLEILTARGPARFQVELADNARTREIGMMCRTALAPDRGMLFDFKTPQEVAFWMHNTLIPLDLFFIKSDFTVLGVVENAEPLTDDPRGVPGLSQYVLETNAGFAREHGLGAGAKVRYTPPGVN